MNQFERRPRHARSTRSGFGIRWTPLSPITDGCRKQSPEVSIRPLGIGVSVRSRQRSGDLRGTERL